MKKTLLLLSILAYSFSFAQDCSNVVDGSSVTVVSGSGDYINAPNIPCPDADGDGVVDSKDECPNIAGTLNGCPDADGDGVKDADDKCPNAAGTLNGCPDSDGDGVADKDDKCPKLAGANQGCPDADNDGVVGKKDRCPNQAGPKENNGCPWPDTDGDGVADKDDKCINTKGDDANGCPKLPAEAIAIINDNAKTIHFNFAKSSLLWKHKVGLNKVAKVMKEFNKVQFTIEGHTDNVGSEENNLKLSEKRAKAVVKYLISKGVNAENLSAVGYGESKPAASNDTAKGRAKNRRAVLITPSAL